MVEHPEHEIDLEAVHARALARAEARARAQAPHDAEPQESRRALLGQTRVRLLGAVGAAAIVGLTVWAIVGTGGSSVPPTPTGAQVAQPIAPTLLSASGLRTLARAVTQPIYWAG